MPQEISPHALCCHLTASDTPGASGLRPHVPYYERTPLAISSLVLAGDVDVHVHGQLVFTLGVRNL